MYTIVIYSCLHIYTAYLLVVHIPITSTSASLNFLCVLFLILWPFACHVCIWDLQFWRLSARAARDSIELSVVGPGRGGVCEREYKGSSSSV